jgi:high frequency lysogenization protein
MSIEDRTLALAGMFQSADLVRQIARQGLVDQSPFESSINSILTLEAASTEAVYGSLKGLKSGLRVLYEQLEPVSQRNMELIHYVFGLILLERKLRKHKDMLEAIRQGVQHAVEQTQSYAVTHPEIIAHLAKLYSQTISTFDFRIQVKGEQRFLENPYNADKVRSLLLAGVRSAVLWRQKGGNRWQLFFSRKKILRCTKRFLEQIDGSNTTK